MNSDEMESQDVPASEQSTQNKKQRIKKSRCWSSFEELPTRSDGSKYVRCIKCGKELSHSTGFGTANLLRHQKICTGTSVSPHSIVRSFTFNHDKFHELIIEAIVKHDLPFSFVEYQGIKAVFEYISPELHLPSRNTVKNHVMRMYEVEKLKVQDLLSKSKGRICLTSDLWSSHTSDGFLALTAHFLDSEWNLHKKVLNFSHMPPPHTGNALVEKINSLICDWGIDKNLFSITLDNASANELTGNKRALRQDVSTRWNSTYHMLDSALYYRQALGQYALADSDFKYCPTVEEWDRIVVISKFLGEFYEVTSLFSGSKYVTSNLFFPKVFKIQHSIHQARMHTNEFMKQMGNVMSAKFDKYWSDYSLILGIAVVMDPRYKLKFVDWAYGLLYGNGSVEFVKFKGTLESIFDEYVVRYSGEIGRRVQVTESCSYSQDEDILFQGFDDAYNEGTNSSMRNELSSYLEEKKLDRKIDIDVLSWWKAEQFRYPILSRLAGDILIIPVSTVASESAFSIGGRVLDQYRSSLLPETVEGLLCCRDWLFDKKYEDSTTMVLPIEDALEVNIV